MLGVASFLFIVCACKDDEVSDNTITTTVSGTITDPEGKPMSEAQVWHSITPDKKVKTKKDGTYSLLVSHQGSFKLHVSKKGYREGKLSVKVNARQHKADLQLDYSYIKALSGTVEDPVGNPIADVVISVSTTDKKFKTGPRGNYSIKIPHSGKFDITLTKTGYKDKTVTVSLETDSSAKNIMMDYGYTTVVSGKVTVRNSPVPMGAEVFASTAPAKKSVTNSDGTYRLTVGHAGNFTITVSKAGYITRIIKIETAKPQETQDIKLEKPSTGKTKVTGYYSQQRDYVGNYPNGEFRMLHKIDWTKVSHAMVWQMALDDNENWYPDFDPNWGANNLNTKERLTTASRYVVNAIRAKNPSIKILAVIATNKEKVYGDWIEQRNGKTRAALISKIITYLESHNLDGLDVDLEQNAITPNWENFIIELKQAFERKNLVLSGALVYFRVNRNATDKGTRAFDLVNIMSYDGTGTWSGPGQHSSLGMARSGFNLYSRMQIPAGKLAIGIPTYGYYWGSGSDKGAFIYKHAVGWDAAYADRDSFTRNGRVHWHNGRPTVREKVKFAKDNGCHLMIFRLDIDASGKYSILNHIAKSMKEFGMTLAD